MGEIVEAGSDVRTMSPGDKVLVSCISACGRCAYCRADAYGQCTNGAGWILGHIVNGTQAEYVRVPHGDLSVHPLPDNIDSGQAVLLSDIFPTAYEVGVRNGRVAPDDTVVIVGAGPIGLAAVATARLYSPGRIVVVDLAASRLGIARELGADVVVEAGRNPESLVKEMTDGLGADVAVEAVGVPETFELCTRVVRPGGHVANVGVHGKPATLHLEELWLRDITVTTGLVDTSSIPMLLHMLARDRLPARRLLTHAFGLDEMEEAYRVFSSPGDTGAVKVVATRPGSAS